MKATELMIGDWVMEDNNRYYRVALGSSNDRFLFENELHGQLPIQAEMNPIPLTEEILKANGFTQYGHHSMLYVNENTLDEVSIHIDYKESVDIDAPDYKYSGWCETVHELQHALRLCGLNDLADNFKIE